MLNIEYDSSTILINGIKFKNLRTTNSRPFTIFNYKNKKCIIKIDDNYYSNTQSVEEAYFYQHILDSKDAKYFPRYVCHERYNKYNFYIITEYVPLRFTATTKSNLEIIKKLENKYNISDLNLTHRPGKTKNWAVHKETNLPIIYDIGIRY